MALVVGDACTAIYTGGITDVALPDVDRLVAILTRRAEFTVANIRIHTRPIYPAVRITRRIHRTHGQRLVAESTGKPKRAEAGVGVYTLPIRAAGYIARRVQTRTQVVFAFFQFIPQVANVYVLAQFLIRVSGVSVRIQFLQGILGEILPRREIGHKLL